MPPRRVGFPWLDHPLATSGGALLALLLLGSAAARWLGSERVGAELPASGPAGYTGGAAPAGVETPSPAGELPPVEPSPTGELPPIEPSPAAVSDDAGEEPATPRRRHPAELRVGTPGDAAFFELRDASGAVLLRAAADGRPRAVAPGPVKIRIERRACPDRPLEHQLELEPGGALSLPVEACPQARSAAPPPRERTAQATPAASRSEAARAADTAPGPASAGPATTARGGGEGWHGEVSAWMIERFDVDGSGLIDTPGEVDGVPCRAWQAIALSYAGGPLGIPLSRLYGFDGGTWVEGALGFAWSVRDQAFLAMQRCGVR